MSRWESVTMGNEWPEEDMIFDLAELFRMFSDSTRIRILYALIKSEMNVTDIAAELEMTVSAISHQLRVLKDARLVRFRREGKTIMYSLSDDHVRTIMNMGIEHLEE